MRSRRQPTTDQRSRNSNSRINITNSGCSQNSTGRNSDKRMQGIPGAINALNLVGKKLNTIHEPGNTNDNWILEDLQSFRQRHIARKPEQAEDENRRVEIDSAGPGHAHGESDVR